MTSVKAYYNLLRFIHSAIFAKITLITALGKYWQIKLVNVACDIIDNC